MAGITDIEFIIFDKSRGLSAYGDVRSQLSGRSFDIALCMHASMRANLLCRSIEAPIRLGFDRKRAKDFQSLFTNRRIDAAPGQHAVEAMMSFAAAIGAAPKPIRWDIPLDENALEFAANFVSPNKKLVVISPCSSNRSRNFRNWSIGRYQAAIQHLRNKGARWY